MSEGRLTPWQVIGATLTCLYIYTLPTPYFRLGTADMSVAYRYAVKNADSLLGLQAPEPLARLVRRAIRTFDVVVR